MSLSYFFTYPDKYFITKIFHSCVLAGRPLIVNPNSSLSTLHLFILTFQEFIINKTGNFPFKNFFIGILHSKHTSVLLLSKNLINRSQQ